MKFSGAPVPSGRWSVVSANWMAQDSGSAGWQRRHVWKDVCCIALILVIYEYCAHTHPADRGRRVESGEWRRILVRCTLHLPFG